VTEPLAKIGEYVRLVEEEDDACVEEHFAVRHHIEELK
jgi:hypothetical protein